jgi:hypothetical protein
MLSLYNIKAKQTTVKNPTANYLVKQIHSTLKDQLCTKQIDNNYIGEVDYLHQIALFSIREAMPSNCTYSPSHLHMEWTISFVNRFISTGWHSRQNARGGGQHRNFPHREGKINGWGSLIPMLEA